MTDVSKMSRTLSGSLINLNSTKMFAEPQAPPPRTNANSIQPIIPKVTTEQIAAHNALKDELQLLLNSIKSEDPSCSTLMNDIHQKYMTSFDRLNKFFNEIQQINLVQSAETENDTILNGLDQDLLNSMDKLSKVCSFGIPFICCGNFNLICYLIYSFISQALSEVRFMVENKNLYNVNGIKSVDFLLSEEISDILDQYFRSN